MTKGPHCLDHIVERTLARAVAPEITGLAEQLRKSHGPGVAAIVAYGSCLRDTATTQSLIDLYVLTDDYSTVSTSMLSRLCCRIAPPNVYFAQWRSGEKTFRCKYACLPLAVFAARMTASNPYFWARFAQPSALVYARNDQAARTVQAAVAVAISTMFDQTRSLSGPGCDVLDIWRRGLQATYATELRSEGPQRAAVIVEADADYYARVFAHLEATRDAAPAAPNWPLRRMTGKLLSVVRLIKAAFTFQGGADYLAWKITRHSGVAVELTDWQRRHPVLASLTLVPKLLRAGAIR